MSSVEKILYEPTDNLVVNDRMDLGEEHFFKLDDGGNEIDWSLGYDIDHNYNWVKELKLKINNYIDDNKKLFLIKENIYNPEKDYNRFSKNYYI